jgi:hypothetical protein
VVDNNFTKLDGASGILDSAITCARLVAVDQPQPNPENDCFLEKAFELRPFDLPDRLLSRFPGLAVQ